MSAKSGFETKVQENDETTDSGYLSGKIEPESDVSGLVSQSSVQEHGQDHSVELQKENKKPQGDKKETQVETEEQQEDSGVVHECYSSDLSDYQSPVALTVPKLTIDDVPPIDLLFEQDEDGDTQLHIAAVHGCQKSMGTLLRLCPSKETLNITNDFHQTALHLAIITANATIARMLVREGASLSHRDLNGDTPLHRAAMSGNVECLQALLAPVPHQPQRKLSSVLNMMTYKGQTCVHLAATRGHLEALQTLVFYGADINAREALGGWTVLHIAASRGDVRLTRYLKERCPGVVVNARDYRGYAPRRIAVKSQVASLFTAADDSDSEYESDSEDEYDSETESLFESYMQKSSPINVA